MHEFKDYIQFKTFLTAKGKSEMDINFPDFGRAEVSQLGAKNKNSQLIYTFSEFTPYNHEAIIDSLKRFSDVKSIEIARNGRINLRIDGFDDMAVQNVLNKIISSGGIIKSIYTEEPSLEDVFIKSTSRVSEDDRA